MTILTDKTLPSKEKKMHFAKKIRIWRGCGLADLYVSLKISLASVRTF